MTTRPDPIPASVSIEHVALGPYGAFLRFYNGGDVIAEYRISLDDVESLHRNITTAVLPVETGRQFDDLAAGHCELCGDIRMVEVERHGRPWREHCPVCEPKIVAARQAIRTWGKDR